VRNKVNISDPLTHAKLQAFIDWKIAMFELILIECPKPFPTEHEAAWRVWRDYFHWCVERSTMMRNTLEDEEAQRLYNPALLAMYRDWKASAASARASST
jgi:hypothetical protein